MVIDLKNNQQAVAPFGIERFCSPRCQRRVLGPFGPSATQIPVPGNFGLENLDFFNFSAESGFLVSGSTLRLEGLLFVSQLFVAE